MYVRTGTGSSPSSFGKRSNRLNSDLSDTDLVEVTADGVKTVRQLLNALFLLVNFNKISNCQSKEYIK